MGRLLLETIKSRSRDKPIHKLFESDLQAAIERWDYVNRRESSKTYKPSSMKCPRCMYYMRRGAPQDDIPTGYQSISMADTGTRRHEAIQAVLEHMESMGYDWRYVDVESYLREKKLRHLFVKGKKGAETHLFDAKYKVSFLCDGIVEQISTGKYYLFEFKNQISFKAQKNKSSIDEEHHNQVVTYCMILDLDGAFVTYENRDNCEICVPELYKVTDAQKEEISSLLLTVEDYVNNEILPPKTLHAAACKWCKYKNLCRKDES